MTIHKAIEFIADTQNKDGGYSIDKQSESDPISTSFAVLALKLFNTKENTIKKAETFLSDTQNNDGSWDATDFIKPKGPDPYKSSTLSTAFVLKALSQ